jgi:uncharacterized protein (DUF58 family)
MRFDPEFLKTLDQLAFASSRAFAGSGRGERRGRSRGRGVEFADYRPYAQGDDFRHIDWKAYKRLNRLLLRLYDEEQDLRVYLFLDTSASMAPHGKFDYAARIAAALCYVGLSHLDRVTLVPFSEQIARDVSTGTARHTIGPVLALLEGLSPEGRTDLWRSISGFARAQRRQWLAVVVSDFLDPAGCERPLKLLASQGHEVVAVHVVSAADRADAESADDVSFVDAETGEERRVEITPGLRRAYARAWAAFDQEVASACTRSGADYVRADVDVPFEQTVLHTFRTGRLLE